MTDPETETGAGMPGDAQEIKRTVTETIIAVSGDPRDHLALGIKIVRKNLPGYDLMDAIKSAVRDYARSPEGQADPNIRHNRFNYGDLVDIPKEFCIAHGFAIQSTFTTERVVNHDECLCESE